MDPLDPSVGLWRGYRRDGWPDGSWVLEGGVIRAVPGAERVELVTRERFRNFDLAVEWKVARGGNSGLLYRVSEEWPQAWQTGPEMQLIDDDHHPDGRTPETSAGALYGLLAPTGAPPCRGGVYHTARVVARGERVEHWMNGCKVVEYELGGARFDELVARSKFKDQPQFGRMHTGHLVLQHHGDEVWFRRVAIRRLPD